MQTKVEYAAYERAVASFLERNAVKPGCHGPLDAERGEPFFSWNPCECCGSHLGGNRETYSFALERGETLVADICVDCVYYLAYGVLDDTTMLEIARDTTAATPATDMDAIAAHARAVDSVRPAPAAQDGGQ